MPDEIQTNPAIPEAPEDTDPHSTAEADAVAAEPEVEVKPEEVEDPAPEDKSDDKPASDEAPADPAEPTPSLDKGEGEALNTAVATEAEGVTPAPLESQGSEGSSLTSLGTPGLSGTEATSGSSGASAPAASQSEPEAPKAAEDKDSPFGGLHDVAKPLEAAVGEEVIEDLEDAAALLYHAIGSLREANLDGLDPELGALVSNLRNQGAGILAALEGIFKRIA